MVAQSDSELTAAFARARKQGEPHQMLEADFIAHYQEHNGQLRLNYGRRRGLTVQGLAQYMVDTHDEQSVEKALRRIYRDLVRAAVKSGQNVPAEVIVQHDELRTAFVNQLRYERGRHTSFDPRAGAITTGHGYRVKRQDGKEPTPEQVAEIAEGVAEIEAVVGDLSDIMAEMGLTIAHTSGKHPFLSRAGGMYNISEGTISTGCRVGGRDVPSLAHELAHGLDETGGERAGVDERAEHSLADREAYLGVGVGEVIREARLRMNSPYIVNEMLSRKRRSGAEKDAASVTRIRMSGKKYWRQPHEIWARLCEQYVATELAARGQEGAVSVEGDYSEIPGYWRQEVFDEFRPAIRDGIERRLAIIRGVDPHALILSSQPRAKRLVKPGEPTREYQSIKMQRGYTQDAPRVELRSFGDGWQVIKEDFNGDEWVTHELSAAGLDREDAEAVAIRILKDGQGAL